MRLDIPRLPASVEQMKRHNTLAALLSAVLLISAQAEAYAAPATPAGATRGPAAPAARGPDKSVTTDSGKEASVPDEAADARNAARTRMRECGHQWSAMKKSGAANGMTWKDYSQGCLARK